jgi:hypothetical protein
VRREALIGIAALALAACSPAAEDACTLTFERILTIDPPPGEEGYADYAAVSPLLPGGRRAVTEENRAEVPILILDARGRFLDTLGGVGSGPGEYRRPQLILPYRRDSVLIIDRINARATVLDSALHVARSFPMTFPAIWGAALTDGSLALSHGMGSPGLRLGRFGPKGEPLGDAPWSYEQAFGQRGDHPLYHVGAEPDGTWWTLSLNQRFEFRHYDAGDSLLAGWEFPAELLAPYEGHPQVSPTNAPAPSIGAGFIDKRGRLWTFASLADSQWAEGLGPSRRAEGQEYWPTTDVHAKLDALVIVAEASTGRILHTWRHDSLPGSPIEPGVILAGSEDDDGWFHPELRRIVPSPACGL